MLNTGDVVGRYHIQRRLGHGGMGTLYLARDPVLERDVALKLFLGDIDAPGARERFVREARATAALGNPNIVTVYDYGDFESQPYIVMEYIHGETLAEVIRRRVDVPVPVKLRWLEELSAAVSYAHGSGVIHRDIKPANLMLDAYGRLKVLDFGISRMLGTLTTSATSRVGTPGYCAPEQIQGGETDHRSDLFSIGAVAYEVFSGAEPFGGENVYAITYRLLHEDPAPLSVLVPGLDPEIEPIVARALQKLPDARFQDGEELRQAFAAVRGRLETDTNATMLRYVPSAQRRPASTGAGTPTPGRTPAVPPSGAAKTAVATPPPEPRRTDRELIARQRVQQFQERLAEARRHLDSHRLDEARRACQEALKLDPGHPEARELIVRIDTESLDVSNSPTMLHVPQRPAGVTAAPSGPQEIEATVVRPLPPQLRTPAAPPAPTPPKADAKPAPKPAPASAGPSASPLAGVTAQWQRLTKSQRQGVMGGAAVVALLVVGGMAAVLWPTGATLMPRTVVFDAVPWAAIERIQNANGEAVPLPADASTPMTLSLAPGTYQVVVVGPPPQQERRTVPLTVGVDGAPAFPVQRFTPMTADEYFKDLLAPATAPPPAEPAPESR